MNKQYNRKLSGIYIRNVSNKPEIRSVIGLFKHLHQQMGITQEQLLQQLYSHSLKELKEQLDLQQGNVMEINIKPIKQLPENKLMTYEDWITQYVAEDPEYVGEDGHMRALESEELMDAYQIYLKQWLKDNK